MTQVKHAIQKMPWRVVCELASEAEPSKRQSHILVLKAPNDTLARDVLAVEARLAVGVKMHFQGGTHTWVPLLADEDNDNLWRVPKLGFDDIVRRVDYIRVEFKTGTRAMWMVDGIAVHKETLPRDTPEADVELLALPRSVPPLLTTLQAVDHSVRTRTVVLDASKPYVDVLTSCIMFNPSLLVTQITVNVVDGDCGSSVHANHFLVPWTSPGTLVIPLCPPQPMHTLILPMGAVSGSFSVQCMLSCVEMTASNLCVT